MRRARPSPLQNRVLPTGEIVADSARGMFTGNRGILPFANGRLGISRWKHHHWIICTLTHPRGKYHGPTPTNAWTPLFFLDEAVGLAAGHRPCAYCRPQAYRAFKTAWEGATGQAASHSDMDRALHKARVRRDRSQIKFEADIKKLPAGTMVRVNEQPHLVLAEALRPYSPTGYGPMIPKPNGNVTVLTPAPTVTLLGSDYAPELHPSAHLPS